MNDKHNFGFDTECKIIRPNGKVRDIITDLYQPQVEGIVSVDTFASDGMPKQHVEQPMRSFVKGFIQRHFVDGTYNGIRLSNPSVDITYYQYSGGIIAGINNTAVTINDNSLGVPGNFSSSTSKGFIFQAPFYNALTQTVDITLRKEVTISTSSPKNIVEVGLGIYANSFSLAIRDRISSIPLSNGDVFRVSITMSFPVSSEKALTKNFFLNLIQLYAENAFSTYKNTAGTAYTSILGSDSLKGLTDASYISTANANETSRGIVIGSGDNDVDWENDYALNTPIASGTSEGQLIANAATVSANSGGLIVSGNSALMEHWREFQNSSPSNVTVREVAVISRPATSLFNPTSNFMLARWLTGDVVVKPGETLRVSWRPKVTV